MLGNFILGFIVPILIGGWVLRKNIKILIIYFPLGVATSTCINSIGFNYFWNILPNTNNQSYAALPMDLGLYPITACLMMYAILQKGAKSWLAILCASCILTVLEWIAKEMGRVLYFNGWNIGWTFVSYLLPLVLVYAYGVIFKRMFNDSP